MPSAAQVSEIIGVIHDAAKEVHPWATALTRLAALFGGGRAHLAVFNPATMETRLIGEGGDPGANGLDHCVMSQALMLARDALPNRVAPGPISSHLRTEYHNEPLCAGPVQLCLASIRTRRPNDAALLALWRHAHRGRWERSHLDLLALLSPHVARGLEWQLEVREQGRERDAFIRALDQLQHGIMLTSDGGRLLFVNRAAQTLAAEGDGITILSATLRAWQPTQNAALQCLVANALGHNGVGRPIGGAMRINRRSGRTHLVVRVIPLGSSPDGRGCRSALVLIIDPAHETRLSASHLQQLYGLTSAEAAVAIRVFRGRGLQSVADELRVTLSTVRVQLQRVFEKTQTHRQAELVRVLLLLHAQIDGTDGDPTSAPATARL